MANLRRAALLLAAAATLLLATPAQASLVLPLPPPVDPYPCDRLVSTDPALQSVLDACSDVTHAVQDLLTWPPRTPCSGSDTLGPILVDCALWAVGQIPHPPAP